MGKDSLYVESFAKGYCGTYDTENECSQVIMGLYPTMASIRRFIEQCKEGFEDINLEVGSVNMDVAIGLISVEDLPRKLGQVIRKHRKKIIYLPIPVHESEQAEDHYVRWILEQSSNEQEIS